MISLPYSKNKRYVLGIDWVIAALDSINKKNTSVGNHSLLVMELNGDLDLSLLRIRLDDFLSDNIVLKGKLARDVFNLAPYWKKCKIDKAKFDLFVETSNNDVSLSEVLDLYSNFVNKPFASFEQYLSFLVYKMPGKTFVGVKFDHKVLDARGAEALMSCLNDFSEQSDNVFDFPQEPFLRNWKSMFDAGQRVNRFLRGMYCEKSYNALKRTVKADNRYNHVIKVFDIDQTKQILLEANDSAGYLMTLPYLLGRSLQSVNKVLFPYSDDESKYLVAVNVDRRGRIVKRENIFFNHVSFFYFRLFKSDLLDDALMFKKLRLQWYDQMKNRIAEAFELSTRLTRIVPLNIFSKLMFRQFINHPAVLSFTYIGEDGYTSNKFMGCSIEDIYHMPIVPVEPGVGIFFTKFHDKIKLVAVALDGCLTKEELETLALDIKYKLVNFCIGEK